MYSNNYVLPIKLKSVLTEARGTLAFISLCDQLHTQLSLSVQIPVFSSSDAALLEVQRVVAPYASGNFGLFNVR